MFKLSVVVSTHQASFEAISFAGSIAESFAQVRAAGYDGAELAVRNAGEVRAEELLRHAAKHSLEIPAIGTGQMWGDEGLSLTSEDEQIRHKIVERLAQHIELAAELDAVVIIGLVRGVFPRPEKREIAREWLKEGLAEVAQMAASRGVKVAVEAINRYETAYVNSVRDGLELLDAIGHDSLGLLLDTFHMNIEEPDMAESIRMCGARIFHFHLADSNRWYPGAGHIDFAALFSALREAGYTGYLSGEFLPKPTGAKSIEKALRYLGPLLEELS